MGLPQAFCSGRFVQRRGGVAIPLNPPVVHTCLLEQSRKFFVFPAISGHFRPTPAIGADSPSGRWGRPVGCRTSGEPGLWIPPPRPSSGQASLERRLGSRGNFCFPGHFRPTPAIGADSPGGRWGRPVSCRTPGETGIPGSGSPIWSRTSFVGVRVGQSRKFLFFRPLSATPGHFPPFPAIIDIGSHRDDRMLKACGNMLRSNRIFVPILTFRLPGTTLEVKRVLTPGRVPSPQVRSRGVIPARSKGCETRQPRHRYRPSDRNATGAGYARSSAAPLRRRRSK